MQKESVQAIQYIVKSADVVGGSARLAGRRVPVWQITLLYKQGIDTHEIAGIYDATLAEIHAALAYYYDHSDEIEAEIAQNDDPYELSDAQKEIMDRVRAQREDDPWMTTTEVADKYGITTATVRQTILRGALPARKSGDAWLIRASDAAAHWEDA